MALKSLRTRLATRFLVPILLIALVALLAGAWVLWTGVSQAFSDQQAVAQNTLEEEQRAERQELEAALESKADTIGLLLARTAPELFKTSDSTDSTIDLSRTFNSLGDFQREARQDRDVAYTAYLNPEGEPVIEADLPENRQGFLEKRYPIRDEGIELGSVLVGMSRSRIEKQLQAGTTRIEAAIQKLDDARVSAQERIILVVVLQVVAVGGVISLVMTLLFRMLVLRPLSETAELINSLSQGSGDLTARLPLLNGDEIDDLRAAVNGFIAKFETIIARLEAVLSQVRKTGIKIASAGTQLAASAQSQQSMATEHASTSTELTATAKEVSATVQQLEDTVREVNAGAEQTDALAGEGREQLELMEAVMDEMSEATEAIAAKLTLLSERAEAINGVVTTINKVASQTQLLSLNAAIEAEKAGEQGKGFGVVATEIRRLADQADAATLDIEHIVREMQSAVSAGVMGMDQMTAKTHRAVEQAQQVSGSIAEIIERVGAMADQFEVVTEGMRSQSEAARQISQSMEEFTMMAQRAAQTSQETSQATQRLNEIAQDLRQLVTEAEAQY